MATNDATFCNAAHVLRRLLTARPISKKHHTLYLALATLLMQWLLWSYVMLVLFEHRLHRHIQRLAPVLEHRRHSAELESSAHLCLTARPGSRRSAAPPPAASARGRRPCTWSFSAAACAPSRRASSLTSRGKGQCVRDGRREHGGCVELLESARQIGPPILMRLVYSFTELGTSDIGSRE